MKKFFPVKIAVITLCIGMMLCIGCLSASDTSSYTGDNLPSEAVAESSYSTSFSPTDSVNSGDITNSEVSTIPSDSEKTNENTQEVANGTDSEEPLPPPVITLGFSGDINFDENWCTMQKLNSCANGLSDCIDPDLLSLTNSFTLFMTNNEFTYSEQGTPMPGKMYTFRANPTRIDLLKEMGTDLVLLANNHIFDYGEDAFNDTLSVLDQAGIDRVGAGCNREEATRILYYDFDSVTVAYTAATRAEKNIMTPEAGENSPGVFRCYDATQYLLSIEEAAQNSDFVVANIHWGNEYSNDAVSSQITLAHDMIDAGADVVIGTHPHVLQGIEYYNGKPIFYSLGNYWFNDKNLYSCVVELNIQGDSGELASARFYPCIQSECRTRAADDAERDEIFTFMEGLSDTITFDEEGYLIPNESILSQ